MRNFPVLTAALLASAASFAAFAQEDATPQLISISPSSGSIVKIAGSTTLKFNLVPSVNLNCTELATLSCDGTQIAAIPTSSKWITQGEEGAALEIISLSFDSKPITAVGEYDIAIPAGFFTFNGGTALSEAIDIHYSIPQTAECNVSPLPGYYTTIPNTYILTFPGAKSITINELDKDADGAEQGIFFDTPQDSQKPETVIVGDRIFINTDSNSNFTRRGTYSLDISAGAISIVDENGDTYVNGETHFIYYLPVVPYPGMEPAPGKVSELSEFRMYFTPEEDCVFNRLYISPSLKPILADGSLGSSIPCALTTPADKVKGSSELNFRLSTGTFTNPGKYRFIISRSGFQAYGYLDDDNPDIKTTAWSSCAYYWDYEIVASLAQIASSYSQTTPAFHDVETIILKLPNAAGETPVIADPNAATIRDMFDEPLTRYTVTLSTDSNEGIALHSDEEVPSLYVNITPPITEEGDYTLFIPAGAVEVNGAKSPMFYMDFNVDNTISGVAVAEASNLPVDVYAIDGTLVARGMQRSNITQLPAGIYIAGGKKVVVK